MALSGIVIISVAVYTGFTVSPPDMRPWLAWIRWINPVFYAFEAIIANEYHGLQAKCVEYLPDYPSLSGLSFVCLEVGAVAGEHFVSGDRYIEKQYGFLYSHLWRNLGILFAFMIGLHLLYFVITELVTDTVSKPESLSFLPGHIPQNMSRGDEEMKDVPKVSKELSQPPSMFPGSLPKHENIFTWKGLCYDIPIKGGTKRLLDDVSGWVKPGTLTALMVCINHSILRSMIGSMLTWLGCIWCRKDYSSECPIAANDRWGCGGGHFGQWPKPQYQHLP